jgi:hypothetical protein
MPGNDHDYHDKDTEREESQYRADSLTRRERDCFNMILVVQALP